ncbi:MAG: hypothetical protein IT373_33295 [Polyangiaceae bacterium]|nr:hypothetical protein [Polyangiaceae bacterium]
MFHRVGTKAFMMAAVLAGVGCATAADTEEGPIATPFEQERVVAPAEPWAPHEGQSSSCGDRIIHLRIGDKGPIIHMRVPALCSARPDPMEDPREPAVTDPGSEVEAPVVLPEELFDDVG